MKKEQHRSAAPLLMQCKGRNKKLNSQVINDILMVISAISLGALLLIFLMGGRTI